MKPKHFGFYEIPDPIWIFWFLWHCSSEREGSCFITTRWEKKSTFLTCPLLTHEVGRSSSLLLGKGWDSDCSAGLCWYHLGCEGKECLITSPLRASTDTISGKGQLSLLFKDGKNPDSSLGLFWHHSSRDRKKRLLTMMWEWRLGSPCVSNDSELGKQENSSGKVCYCPPGTKLPPIYSAFSGNYPGRGLESLVTTSWEYKSGLPTQPQLAWIKIGVTIFLCCLARAEWLLPKSFLPCYAVPFLVFWLETAGFSICACWFPGWQLLQFQVWAVLGEKKTQGTHPISFLESWGP